MKGLRPVLDVTLATRTKGSGEEGSKEKEKEEVCISEIHEAKRQSFIKSVEQ